MSMMPTVPVSEQTVALARKLAQEHGCTPPQAINTAVRGWSHNAFGEVEAPIPREIEGLLYRAIVRQDDQARDDERLQDWVTRNVVEFPVRDR